MLRISIFCAIIGYFVILVLTPSPFKMWMFVLVIHGF